MRLKLIISTTSTYLLLSCFNAHASLIELDLNAVGDGLLTYDTVSQLEWLDVTETKYISASAILSGEGGWIDLGFRYATTSEVSDLAISAGFTNLTGVQSSDQFEVATMFISLLGNTSGNTFNAATTGRAGIGDFGNNTINTPTFIASYTNVGMADIENNIGMTLSYGGSNNSGSFLVRDHVSPVPVPAAFWLFGSGLISLISIARYKKYTY